MIKFDESVRDWKEDFAGENGMYQCRCVKCGGYFIGHKRRPLCKVCGTPSEAFKKLVAAVEFAMRLEKIEEDSLRASGWPVGSGPMDACAQNLKMFGEVLAEAKKEMP